jgi:hypothetical protein
MATAFACQLLTSLALRVVVAAEQINGDPAQRAETLAHFPSSTFNRVAIVVMPECEQLLDYHSKRNDIWKRRYTSQEVVDHLTASIQAPTTSEFDKVRDS